METIGAALVGAMGVVVAAWMGQRNKRVLDDHATALHTQVATSNGQTLGELVESLDDRTEKLEHVIISHLFDHLKDNARHNERRIPDV